MGATGRRQAPNPGALVGNGVYLCQLRAGDFRAVTRLVLMK